MKYYILLSFIFFSACSNYQTSAVVSKSLYLNKPLMKFEMDNGFCYQKKRLDDGSYKCLWSSSNNFTNNLFDDEYPPCRLELLTDSKKIVKKITIIEKSLGCVGAIK